MVMARGLAAMSLSYTSWHSLSHDCLLPGFLPQNLVMEGSRRAGDIRIDVSIDVESIMTMF